MKKLRIVLLIVAVLVSVGGVALGQANNGITILIKDVETPDTRAGQGKYLDVKRESAPDDGKDSALSEGDRTTLDPEMLTAIRAGEVFDQISAQREERDAIKKRNAKKEAVAEAIRQRFAGTPEGRNIIQAKEWLSSSLMPYAGLIQVIDRSEQELAMDETARNGVSQTMRGGVTHYMRVIVGDVKETKTETQSYGVKTVAVNKTLTVSVTVNDLNDRTVFSGTYKSDKQDVHTSYGNTTGGDAHEEMLKAALTQAAEAIGKQFTAKVRVELVPPMTEKDSFDPGVVAVRINEEDIMPGDERLFLKGTQLSISINSEDYRAAIAPRAVKGDETIKIPLQSAYGWVKFSVPASLGVDISAVNFELSDTNNAPEVVYGEGPHRIKKGRYELKATAEGYSPYINKAFAVQSGTEEKPVSVPIALRPEPVVSAPAQQ